jgi:biotin transport system substrate-specific component
MNQTELQSNTGSLATDNTVVKTVLTILGVAALLAVAAQIKIGGPVPTTPQTLLVMAFALAFGPRLASTGVAVFLALGTAAPAWFFAAPSGATAGYLAGFLIAPWIIALVLGSQPRPRFWRVPVALLAGETLIFALGIAGLAAWWSLAIGQTVVVSDLLNFGVVQFLPHEAVKVAIVLAAAPYLLQIRRRWFTKG